jgi:parallel beta-helix repeat protein
MENCGNAITLQSVDYGGVASENTKNASGVQQNSSQYFEDFTITGNVITGTEATSTPLPAIYVVGEATGQAYNGTITGNTINDSGTTSITVEYGNRVNVSNNTIYNSGLYGILVKWSNDCNVTANNINTTDDHALMTTLGTNHMVNGNFIRLAGERGIYISGDDNTVVSNNYIFGASRNNATGTEAMYTDGTVTPCTWTGNVVRKVGSGNEYTYALKTGNGTHYIRGNDFQIGTSGRLSLSGTIQGMTAFTLSKLGTMGSTGDETNMEWVAPTSGYVKRFNIRLDSGSANFRPNINDAQPAAGAVNTAGSTTLGGANQAFEYAAGDRIGIEQTSAGSSPSGLMATFWVIENGSDL